MYLVLQNQLVLTSPPTVIAVAHSQAFTMPFPDDDAIDLTIVIIALTGGGDPALQVTIEESDDDENWATNFSMLFQHITVGAIIGPLAGLSAKRYRIRWDFADAGLTNFVTCVLAANVETHHE